MHHMDRRASDRRRIDVPAHCVVPGITRPFCSCGWRAQAGSDGEVSTERHLEETSTPSRLAQEVEA